MSAQSWNTLKHKFSEKEHAAIKREAREELRRIGFDKLRKARQKTQVAVAGKLNIPQASVSRMEKRSDVLLSTLREYIGALGGRLEVRAVFPDAYFELDSFSESGTVRAKQPRKASGAAHGNAKSSAAKQR